MAKPGDVQQKVEITADPVTEYAQWKKQVEELKAQAETADVFDFARAVAILAKVPAKQRDHKLLADWTQNRDRLKELWDRVESGWRNMAEDELADQLQEIVTIHPDHPRAKPWLAQFGTAERRQRKLGSGKVGDVIEVPLSSSLKMQFAWVSPGTSCRLAVAAATGAAKVHAGQGFVVWRLPGDPGRVAGGHGRQPQPFQEQATAPG